MRGDWPHNSPSPLSDLARKICHTKMYLFWRLGCGCCGLVVCGSISDVDDGFDESEEHGVGGAGPFQVQDGVELDVHSGGHDGVDVNGSGGGRSDGDSGAAGRGDGGGLILGGGECIASCTCTYYFCIWCRVQRS